MKKLKDIEVTTIIKFTLKDGNYIKREISIKNNEDLKEYFKRVRTAFLKITKQVLKSD